jgi:hypothetical protein
MIITCNHHRALARHEWIRNHYCSDVLSREPYRLENTFFFKYVFLFFRSLLFSRLCFRGEIFAVESFYSHARNHLLLRDLRAPYKQRRVQMDRTRFPRSWLPSSRVRAYSRLVYSIAPLMSGVGNSSAPNEAQTGLVALSGSSSRLIDLFQF